MIHLRRCLAVVLLCVSTTATAGAQSVRASVPPLSELSRSLQDLAAKVSPAVVQIFVTGYAPPDEKEPYYEIHFTTPDKNWVVEVNPDGTVRRSRSPPKALRR